MLAAVAVLLIAVLMAAGLIARDLAARRPRSGSAEHLIDQLSQAAKLYELDGNAVYPPGDACRYTIFGGADAYFRSCACEWDRFLALYQLGSEYHTVDRRLLPNRQ